MLRSPCPGWVQKRANPGLFRNMDKVCKSTDPSVLRIPEKWGKPGKSALIFLGEAAFPHGALVVEAHQHGAACAFEPVPACMEMRK